MKYVVSRAEEYSLAVRTGPSQRAVSNLDFEPKSTSQKSPGDIRTGVLISLSLPTNISQLFRLCVMYTEIFKHLDTDLIFLSSKYLELDI